MVFAGVLIGLAILMTLGGLLAAQRWLLIIAGLLLVAGLVVSVVFGRGKTRTRDNETRDR
jgi:cytochrome c oxidase subunit IV